MTAATDLPEATLGKGLRTDRCAAVPTTKTFGVLRFLVDAFVIDSGSFH
jgi:hypothetical protein